MESQSDFKKINSAGIDFHKSGGLVPAIIQDKVSQKILMLGYMNEEAFNKTQKKGFVHFFSRSKNRLWIKGETSGNYLEVKNIQIDCDEDTLLIQVLPYGKVCHKGTFTCFGEEEENGDFLYQLERIIEERRNASPENSYTASLFTKGLNKIVQKSGEEMIELLIEAKDNNKKLFLNEAADLLYHLLVLFARKNVNLEEVSTVLRERHK
ncbi:MAG: bifunctional phosphoribosyl-AMP cyclohydrolase/phosphoribosyl-ATP diphosphatase HisIE [Bacteroidales bacterium]